MKHKIKLFASPSFGLFQQAFSPCCNLKIKIRTKTPANKSAQKKNPGNQPGFLHKCTAFIYAFLQLGMGQQLAGLQSTGLHVCCVVHCLAFLAFLPFLLLASAPVANEHTIASINIFFIIFFNN